MSNHKSTESALKNLKVQVGQLAKQIADKSSTRFVANTEQNPKEECKTVMTRSKRFVEVEDEDSVVHEKKTVDKKSTDGKTVSSVVGVGLRSPCLNLCKIVVVVVLVDDEEVGIGYGIGEDENEILGLLGFLLLGLLHVLLNLESDFEDEDDEVVVG